MQPSVAESESRPANAQSFLTDGWRKYIGWAQIVAAAMGLVGLRTTIFLLPEGAIARLAIVLALAYFTLGVLASVLLLRDRPAGVPLSLLVQGLQVVTVSRAGGAVLSFLLGPTIHVSFWAVGLGLTAGLGGHAGATLFYGRVPFAMGLDLTMNVTSNLVQPESDALTFSVNIIAAIAARELFKEWLRSDT